MADNDLKVIVKAKELAVHSFKLEERTLSLPWRGSENQRIIDVKESWERGSVVLWEGGEGDA